jgi:hypothetical protein
VWKKSGVTLQVRATERIAPEKRRFHSLHLIDK